MENQLALIMQLIVGIECLNSQHDRIRSGLATAKALVLAVSFFGNNIIIRHKWNTATQATT